MIKVYFDYGTTSDLVAVFADEELYSACLPALEIEARKARGHVIENIISGEMEDV